MLRVTVPAAEAGAAVTFRTAAMAANTTAATPRTERPDGRWRVGFDRLDGETGLDM